MTYSEANLKLRTMDLGKWFCPLIRDKCNTDCVCYIEPTIRNGYLRAQGMNKEILGKIDKETKEKYADKWDIKGNSCGNVMFFGE